MFLPSIDIFVFMFLLMDEMFWVDVGDEEVFVLQDGRKLHFVFAVELLQVLSALECFLSYQLQI